MKRNLKLVVNNQKGNVQHSLFITEQHEIDNGRALVLRTKQSGEVYHLRMWIGAERKYYRESLRTKHLETAIARGETKFNEISYKTDSGKRIFSPTLQQAIEAYLERRQEDVDGGQIVQGRHRTMKTQLKHVGERLGQSTRLSSLDNKSLYGYRKWRAGRGAQDVTIRNEQATINAMCRFAHEEGMFDIPKFIFPSITIRGASKDAIRRATYTDEEYRRLYKALRTYTAKKKTNDENDRFIRELVRH